MTFALDNAQTQRSVLPEVSPEASSVEQTDPDALSVAQGKLFDVNADS